MNAPMHAPAGLAFMFATIREEGETPLGPHVHAQRAYPLARQIVESALTSSYDAQRHDALAKAPLAMFPGLDDEPTAMTVAEAAFAVGFASCWLLMQTLRGGAQ